MIGDRRLRGLFFHVSHPVRGLKPIKHPGAASPPPRLEWRYPVAGRVKAAWQWDHVITVGPVRPVASRSWETFRAMSTRGASITCTHHTSINNGSLPVS